MVQGRIGTYKGKLFTKGEDMCIFYDRYVKAYTTKTDSFAAPERYYQLSYFKENFENDIDECVEVWLLNNMEDALVRYKKEDLAKPNYINKIRDAVFNGYNSVPLYMTEWIVPKSIYDEIKKTIKE